VVSPDGRWVAFESNRSGDYELYAVDWDGRQVRRLTDDPARDQVPAFAPDGSGLIFQSDRAGSVDLYTVPFAP
jgi:TolB protein